MSKKTMFIFLLFYAISNIGCFSYYSYQDFNRYQTLLNTFKYPAKLQMNTGEININLVDLYSVKRGNTLQMTFSFNVKNLSKNAIFFKENFISLHASTDTFYLEMLYSTYDSQGKFHASKRANKSSLTIAPLDTISNMSFQFVGSKNYSFDTYKQSFMKDTLILELYDDKNNKFTEYMIGNEFHQSKRLF